jgi:hypothetical protein
MSLTIPSSYSTYVKKSAIKENWLFQLYYDSSNFTGLAFYDTDVSSVHYYGAVLNRPVIREALNLARSTAKTSNITLDIANFTFNGSDFSAELFGGTNKYINHTFKVYVQFEDEGTLSNCLQVYEGRIIGLSHTSNKIKLTATEQRPWDFIEIPNTKTTTGKVWIPVSYGNFTANPNTTFASPQYATSLTSYDYRPVPLNTGYTKKGWFWAVNGDQTEASGGHLAFYDASADLFIPFAVASSGTTTEDGAKLLTTNADQKRALSIRPGSSDTDSTDAEITTANLSNMYDTDGNTYGSFSINVSSVDNSYIHTEILNTKALVGDFSQGTVYLKYEIVVTSISGDLSSVKVELNTNYGNISDTVTASKATTTGSQSLTDYDGDLTLVITFTADDSSLTGDLNAEVRIYDVYSTVEMMAADFKESGLYTAGDGLTKGYTGGGGAAITDIHEAHRDLLNRYAGWDDSDANIDGWTALDSARSGWNIRWWQLDPQPMQKILNQMQYEGCFIFKYRPDGTGKYIYVTNNPSADFTLDKDDLTNFEISHTPFGELLTKQEIQYDRHPAKNDYISSATHTNSTARANWNIQSKENIAQIKLDMLTANIAGGSTANDDFANYYDAIFGTIKLIVSGDIVSPEFYGIEVGDILNFDNSNMIIAPFGDSWTGKDFIVTSTQRQPGQIRFTAREI